MAVTTGGAGRNTGCAQGQPVPLAGAGRRAPPDRGKSDGNKNIISSDMSWQEPHEVTRPERVRARDLLENGASAHNCTRKRGL